MDRRIPPTDFPEELADFLPDVQAKALEIANQLLQDHPDMTARQALKWGLQRAERWWIDRAG